MHYPERLTGVLRQLQHCGASDPSAVSGSGGAFRCGCVVRIELVTDDSHSLVTAANFTSNGCGYMLAAAEAVCLKIAGTSVKDLGGANDGLIDRWVREFIGEVPIDRSECLRANRDALHASLNSLRARRITEYIGELPLVCTCFGVTEQTIGDLIAAGKIVDLDDAERMTNAGTGCGSCRMLIDEMLDGTR